MNTRSDSNLFFVVVKDSLGWTALRWRGKRLQCLTFAHKTAASAKKEILTWCGPPGVVPVGKSEFTTDLFDEHRELLHRLDKFTQMLVRGKRSKKPLDDFRDVPIDRTGWTPFRRSVMEAVRGIEPGEPLTYGQVATLAGSPRACRAVGNIMAANPIPLLIPCHRVVAASGLGGYSLRCGLEMKERLLKLESAWEESV